MTHDEQITLALATLQRERETGANMLNDTVRCLAVELERLRPVARAAMELSDSLDTRGMITDVNKLSALADAVASMPAYGDHVR